MLTAYTIIFLDSVSGVYNTTAPLANFSGIILFPKVMSFVSHWCLTGVDAAVKYQCDIYLVAFFVIRKTDQVTKRRKFV